MAEATQGIMVLPPIILGVIIGFYELILIHQDENFRGSHWFSHGLHATAWAIAAVFVTMNVQFIFQTFSALEAIPFIGNVLMFRILIGFITMIKIHSVSAVVKGSIAGTKGMKESWAHSFVVAALIVAAPYVWPFVQPFFARFLPV